MTYNEAEEYKESHTDVIGQYYNGVPPFRILSLLIAPKSKEFKDRMEVLKKCLTDIYDNTQALTRLGFLNENLDVYIIGTDNSVYFEKLLYDYLSETSNAS